MAHTCGRALPNSPESNLKDIEATGGLTTRKANSVKKQKIVIGVLTAPKI